MCHFHIISNVDQRCVVVIRNAHPLAINMRMGHHVNVISDGNTSLVQAPMAAGRDVRVDLAVWIVTANTRVIATTPCVRGFSSGGDRTRDEAPEERAIYWERRAENGNHDFNNTQHTPWNDVPYRDFSSSFSLIPAQALLTARI